MRIAIDKGLIAEILETAKARPDREVCGLLLGDETRVTGVMATANIAVDPAVAFEIDPGALFAAMRAERAGGPRLIGHYHSHPGGRAVPSPRDAAAAEAGKLWLIAGDGAVTAWWAAPGGSVEGMFEPVELVDAAALHNEGSAVTRAGFRLPEDNR